MRLSRFGVQRRTGVAAALAAVICSLLALAAAAVPVPLLQMAEAELHLQPVLGSNSSSSSDTNTTSFTVVGVHLTMVADTPVSAKLAVLLPAAATGGGAPASNGSAAGGGWAPADPAHLWLDPPTLTWRPGESGTKWVRLRSAAELPMALVLDAGAGDTTDSKSDLLAGVGSAQPVLRVQLAGASGAAIAAAPLNITELLLEGQAGEADSLPLFGFIANQVAYPPARGSGTNTGKSGSSGAASIPVRLLGGRLDAPATLRYALRLLPPPSARAAQRPQQFLPTKALQGFLHFAPPTPGSAAGGKNSTASVKVEQRITLPLAWARIPPEAEYRMAVELEGVYRARVAPQAGAVALHIFGTPTGSCPPGSSLMELPLNGSSSLAVASPGSTAAGRPDEPPVGRNGSAGFLLSPNGTVIYLSSSVLLGVHDYGAQVEADAKEVTLCLRVGPGGGEADGEFGVATVASYQAAGRLVEAVALAPEDESDAVEACGCTVGGEEEDTFADGGGCEYAAWVLPLLPGQNLFNVSLGPPEEGGAAEDEGAPAAEPSQSAISTSLGSREEHASLAVVRLADPQHAELATLTVRTSDDVDRILCGPALRNPENASSRGLGDANRGMQLPWVPSPCRPDKLLVLNVSDASHMVTLTPALKHPDVPGVRVEVNGQVLSRGGDVAADRLQDTTAAVDLEQRGTASFLPSAFILGLQPGGKLEVQVVVVAEDGVTTSHYPLLFVRVESEEQLSIAEMSDEGGTADNLAAGADTAVGRRRGWPVPPAQQPMCSVCPSGWAAEAVNSSSCHMCPPGTFAPGPQSPACRPCPSGTFGYSWGSAYCKNCIEGTYAPQDSSSLCLACPEGTTTLDDGRSSCVLLPPGGYTAPSYAVLVSFYVNLNGLELEDVVVRAGVNGDPEAIVASLIRADTALAFNISRDNVQVVEMRRVARRTLSANVTAMLGVDVPAGATDEEIAAALEVERLSADKPIQMLSANPDRFFNRTTEALEVQAQGGMHSLSNVAGPSCAGLMWAMLAPGIAAIIAGSGLVTVGCKRSKSCAAWRGAAARRLSTTRLAPNPMRYSKYGGGMSSSGGGGDRGGIGGSSSSSTVPGSGSGGPGTSGG